MMIALHWKNHCEFLILSFMVRKTDMAAWITARLITQDNRPFLVEAIMDEYVRLEGTSIAKAKMRYLEFIRRLPMFGTSLFPVKASE